MGYVGVIHGFKTVKAESNNKRAPSSFSEDLFQPWDNVTYEAMGNEVRLMDGTVIYNNTGSKGGFNGDQTAIFGHNYNGSKNSNHRHSKNSIFFKTGPKVREKDNDISTSDFSSKNYMYPTGICIKSDARNNGNSYGGGFTCRGTEGYPFTVRGISFDYFIDDDIGVISSSGTNHKLHSAAAFKFYTRQQINRIWGIWYQYSTNRYICKTLTPNGDNWGGRANSNVNAGKYIFRNSGSFTKGEGDEIMRPLENYPEGDKKRNQDQFLENKKFRIRAMINKNESPPANSIFLGFHWQHSYGTSDTQKIKLFNVSNVQIIDPMSAALFYDNPAYHGFDPLESPYSIIRPALYNRGYPLDKNNGPIALYQISTVDTDA